MTTSLRGQGASEPPGLILDEEQFYPRNEAKAKVLVKFRQREAGQSRSRRIGAIGADNRGSRLLREAHRGRSSEDEGSLTDHHGRRIPPPSLLLRPSAHPIHDRDASRDGERSRPDPPGARGSPNPSDLRVALRRGDELPLCLPPWQA